MNKSYEIPFTDNKDVCRMIRAFMKNPKLYSPECVVIPSDGPIRILSPVETKSPFFSAVLARDDTEAVICTAGLGRTDTPRVVLAYIAGIRKLCLLFPEP